MQKSRTYNGLVLDGSKKGQSISNETSMMLVHVLSDVGPTPFGNEVDLQKPVADFETYHYSDITTSDGELGFWSKNGILRPHEIVEILSSSFQENERKRDKR